MRRYHLCRLVQMVINYYMGYKQNTGIVYGYVLATSLRSIKCLCKLTLNLYPSETEVHPSRNTIQLLLKLIITIKLSIYAHVYVTNYSISQAMAHCIRLCSYNF
jgi:hypothetical protein